VKRHLLLSVLLLLGASLINAQEPLPPGDYFAIGTFDEAGENSQLIAFAPGSDEGIILATTPDAGPDVSPDGRWFAEFGARTLVYGEIGREAFEVPMPESATRLTGLTFKADSSALAYTYADADGNWSVNLLDLASGETTSFSGQIKPLNEPLPPFVFYGVPRVLNWNGSMLIVQLFDPISLSDGYNGLFSIDISGLTPGETEQPAQEAVSLFAPLYEKFPYYFGELWNNPGAQAPVPGLTNAWSLSPDGTMIAYPYYDPENRIQNRVPCQQGCTDEWPNRIVVFDLFASEVVIDLGAAEGDGLWLPVWSQDNRIIAFPTGSFFQGNSFGSPRLGMINLDTMSPTTEVLLSIDTDSFVNLRAICGDTLFYTYVDSIDNFVGTLTSVPMDGSEDPTALFSADILNTAGCIRKD
jgi:hypothetical protein